MDYDDYASEMDGSNDLRSQDEREIEFRGTGFQGEELDLNEGIGNDWLAQNDISGNKVDVSTGADSTDSVRSDRLLSSQIRYLPDPSNQNPNPHWSDGIPVDGHGVVIEDLNEARIERRRLEQETSVTGGVLPPNTYGTDTAPDVTGSIHREYNKHGDLIWKDAKSAHTIQEAIAINNARAADVAKAKEERAGSARAEKSEEEAISGLSESLLIERTGHLSLSVQRLTRDILSGNIDVSIHGLRQIDVMASVEAFEDATGVPAAETAAKMNMPKDAYIGDITTIDPVTMKPTEVRKHIPSRQDVVQTLGTMRSSDEYLQIGPGGRMVGQRLSEKANDKANDQLMNAFQGIRDIAPSYFTDAAKKYGPTNLYAQRTRQLEGELTNWILDKDRSWSSDVFLPTPNELSTEGLKATASVGTFGGLNSGQKNTTSPFTYIQHAAAIEKARGQGEITVAEQESIIKSAPSLSNTLRPIDWNASDPIHSQKVAMAELEYKVRGIRDPLRRFALSTRDEYRGNTERVQGRDTVDDEQALQFEERNQVSSFLDMGGLDTYRNLGVEGDKSEADRYMAEIKSGVPDEFDFKEEKEFDPDLPNFFRLDKIHKPNFFNPTHSKDSFAMPGSDEERYALQVLDKNSPEQGSKEWLAQREGMVTGSKAKELWKGKGDERLAITLAKERMGIADDISNAYTVRGSKKEDVVLRSFMANEGKGLTHREAFFETNSKLSGFGASPDGRLFDSEGKSAGLLEMKYFGDRTFQSVVKDTMPQMQMQMMVTGEKQTHLYAMNADTGQMKHEVVSADKEMQDELLELGMSALEVTKSLDKYGKIIDMEGKVKGARRPKSSTASHASEKTMEKATVVVLTEEEQAAMTAFNYSGSNPVSEGNGSAANTVFAEQMRAMHNKEQRDKAKAILESTNSPLKGSDRNKKKGDKVSNPVPAPAQNFISTSNPSNSAEGTLFAEKMIKEEQRDLAKEALEGAKGVGYEMTMTNPEFKSPIRDSRNLENSASNTLFAERMAKAEQASLSKEALDAAKSTSYKMTMTNPEFKSPIRDSRNPDNSASGTLFAEKMIKAEQASLVKEALEDSRGVGYSMTMTNPEFKPTPIRDSRNPDNSASGTLFAEKMIKAEQASLSKEALEEAKGVGYEMTMTNPEFKPTPIRDSRNPENSASNTLFAEKMMKAEQSSLAKEALEDSKGVGYEMTMTNPELKPTPIRDSRNTENSASGTLFAEQMMKEDHRNKLKDALLEAGKPDAVYTDPKYTAMDRYDGVDKPDVARSEFAAYEEAQSRNIRSLNDASKSLSNFQSAVGKSIAVLGEISSIALSGTETGMEEIRLRSEEGFESAGHARGTRIALMAGGLSDTGATKVMSRAGTLVKGFDNKTEAARLFTEMHVAKGNAEDSIRNKVNIPDIDVLKSFSQQEMLKYQTGELSKLDPQDRAYAAEYLFGNKELATYEEVEGKSVLDVDKYIDPDGTRAQYKGVVKGELFKQRATEELGSVNEETGFASVMGKTISNTATTIGGGVVGAIATAAAIKALKSKFFPSTGNLVESSSANTDSTRSSLQKAKDAILNNKGKIGAAAVTGLAVYGIREMLDVEEGSTLDTMLNIGEGAAKGSIFGPVGAIGGAADATLKEMVDTSGVATPGHFWSGNNQGAAAMFKSAQEADEVVVPSSDIQYVGDSIAKAGSEKAGYVVNNNIEVNTNVDKEGINSEVLENGDELFRDITKWKSGR